MGLRWVERDLALRGTVLFRGGIPLRSEELLAQLPSAFEVQPLPDNPSERWRCRLSHPRYGVAEVFCPREQVMPPGELVDFDPRLTPKEKEMVSLAGSRVGLRLEPMESDLLRERKRLLRFLATVAGDAGLVGLDELALCWWSPQALAEELAHDAPVDISALFTMHLVGPGSSDSSAAQPYWLHTHGLQEVGYCDFDILNPSPDSHARGYDALRSLAFAIVEEALTPGGEPFPVVRPGGEVRLVPAREVLRHAGSDQREWRESVDETHLLGHAVVCDEKVPRRFFGLAPGRPRPSGFFQRDFPDGPLIQFSRAASDLMADRARQTYAYFRALRDEFAGLELLSLVKLGYPVDRDDPEAREHIWFEVHDCAEHSIDATCINQPYDVSSLREGLRGPHPVELLSDWTIYTPFGSINPRYQYAARALRANPDAARRSVRP